MATRATSGSTFRILTNRSRATPLGAFIAPIAFTARFHCDLLELHPIAQ
jgi:hypothetical protein